MENKYSKFLAKTAPLFGFADYRITVKRRNTPSDRGAIATAEVDVYEKTLSITLFPDFYASKTDKVNVLLHEIIHARVSLYRIKFENRVAQIEYEEEEDCVNDLTRGVLSFGRR